MIHAMNKSATPLLPKLLLVGVASATMAIGASAAVSATTEPPPEPADSAAPAAGSAAPDVAAFCDATVAAVAAAQSEDPEVMMPAFEALVTASPEDVLAGGRSNHRHGTAEPGNQEFDEPWTAMIDYVRANCGFAEINDVPLRVHVRRGSGRSARRTDHPHRRSKSAQEVHEIDHHPHQRRCHPVGGGAPPAPGRGSGHDGDVPRWRVRGLPRDQSIHALGSHARPLRGHLLLPPGLHHLRCSSR